METKVLEEIGLTESEIKVYLALLEMGSSKKGPLVKKAGISSSKIYEVVDKLIARGLASYVLKNRVKYFHAAPPRMIQAHLEEKQEQLLRYHKALDKLLPHLELKRFLHKTTDAEVYLGWKGMQTVYADLLETLQPSESFYVFGASKGADTKRVRSFYTRFNKKVIERKFQPYIIFNECARGNIEDVEKNARVRYLNQITPAEILIYKNETAIVLLEDEPVIVLIHGESVAKSFKAYFEAMWMISKK